MNTSHAKIGYARTSTTDQNLDTQIAALKAAGCGMVRTEQKSGASLEGRPELKTILDFIHAGETLVVIRIDRLARSLNSSPVFQRYSMPTVIPLVSQTSRLIGTASSRSLVALVILLSTILHGFSVGWAMDNLQKE